MIKCKRCERWLSICRCPPAKIELAPADGSDHTVGLDEELGDFNAAIDIHEKAVVTQVLSAGRGGRG